jgi:hypothetical protein
MLEGTFDFNKTPMAPPGTKVIIHEKPEQCQSWDPHGTDGWYLGPALEHYRCYRVFTNKTRAERISDTVDFFPENTSAPFQTQTDIAVQAATELVKVLHNPLPATPFTTVGTKQIAALKQLAKIINHRITTEPQPPPRVTASVPPAPPRVEPTVVSPSLQIQAPSNNITTTPTLPHRYPTRHIISQYSQDEEANLITNMPTTGDGIHTTNQSSQQNWAHAVIDPDTGASLEYCHLIKSDKHRDTWLKSFANELGRLAQGIKGRVKSTSTILFINHKEIPQDRRKDVTYGRICCNVRPQKEEQHRTRLTVGGDRIDYDGDVSTPTADPTTAKLLINSVISTPGAKYLCGDLSNFYLESDMERYEYMRLPMTVVPPEIIEAYNLHDKEHNGHIYMEIRRGVYGLPQAGLLAN